MDNDARKLISDLDIGEERARELMNEIFKIASKIWKKREGLLIVDNAKELLSLARNEREAYFIGVVATIIAHDIRAMSNPFFYFEHISVAEETVEILERMGVEDADNG